MKPEEQMYREAIRALEFIKKAYENLDANAAGMGRLVGPGLDCPVRIKTYGELYQYHAAVMQMAKEALEEVQQYRELGTVRELKELKESSLSGLELAELAVALRMLKQYQAVETVRECREAVGKQKEKKPVILNRKTDNADRRMYIAEHFKCPACDNESVYFGGLPKHCQNCGQKLKRNSK